MTKVAKTWMTICLMMSKVPKASSRSVHRPDPSSARLTGSLEGDKRISHLCASLDGNPGE